MTLCLFQKMLFNLGPLGFESRTLTQQVTSVLRFYMWNNLYVRCLGFKILTEFTYDPGFYKKMFIDRNI